MVRKKYSAGAVKLSFWFLEFRKVVDLLDKKKTIEEIKGLNQEKNIFGAPTVQRANQILNTIIARIRCLKPSFYSLFLNSDVSTQKLFTLAVALRIKYKKFAHKIQKN